MFARPIVKAPRGMYVLPLALLLALPLALGLALTGSATPAFASADRPDAPKITFPTSGSTNLGTASIVVVGTGTPGDSVYVNAFPTLAEYKAVRANDQHLYEQWKAGNEGGFGGPPGATVGVTGLWSYTLTTADLSPNIRNGVTYISAHQFDLSQSSSTFFPVSAYSPAIKVFTIAPPVRGVPTAHHPEVAPGSVAAPSVFSNLAAFDWSTFTPAHVAITAGMALVLTLLLGFPTALLNSSLEASYAERSRRLKPITDFVGRAFVSVRAAWMRASGRIPKPARTALWFLVAAIISGFADPTFGFTLESFRLLLSLFAAFGLLNVLGAYVTWWTTARAAGTQRPTFPARPSNLVILIVTVIVARIIQLEPSLVFGAVLGLDFGVTLAGSAKVRVIIAGAGYSSIVGLAAWVGYSLVSQTSSAFGVVLVREFFSQLAVAGLATLPVSLLPLKALSGEAIFEWRRVVWGISYAVGLLLFLFVLLPMPFSWSGVTEPLVAWVALFVAYSVLAVLVWLAVRYHWFGRLRRPAPLPTAKG